MQSVHNTKLNSRSIFKNMAVLATGSVFAKVVGIISIPLITRIYSPEHLAILALFTAMASLIMPFGSLRYSVALPLPRHDALALNLAVISFLFLILVTSIAIVALAFSAEPTMTMLSVPSLISYWWLLPIATFSAGLFEILNSWAMREKEFKVIAKANVWQSMLGEITKIGLGLLDFKGVGLIIGHVVKQSAGIGSLSKVFIIKLRAYKNKITKKRMFFLIKYYKDYPKYRLPSQFLMVFSMQAPLLFSAWLYGAEVTGQLGLALMALALPITLFGQTTGQAYYVEISKIGRKKPEKILAITKSITIKLFLVSLPPFLILIFFSPFLFRLVFGDEWGQAGIFASYLAVALITQFISSPIMNILQVFEKQKLGFYLHLFRAIVVTSLFICASFLMINEEAIILIYSFILAFIYVFYYHILIRVIVNAKNLVASS